MFSRILHANDGSEHAFNALSLALKIARHSNADLHMVCVEEIDYLPETMEDVRQETGTAARRFHSVVNRARSLAEEFRSSSRPTSSRGIPYATSSISRAISRPICSWSAPAATPRSMTA